MSPDVTLPLECHKFAEHLLGVGHQTSPTPTAPRTLQITGAARYIWGHPGCCWAGPSSQQLEPKIMHSPGCLLESPSGLPGGGTCGGTLPDLSTHFPFFSDVSPRMGAGSLTVPQQGT